MFVSLYRKCTAVLRHRNKVSSGDRKFHEFRNFGGYCVFFLLADTKKFSTLRHSYIIELKYLPSKATDREAKTAKEQAVEQLNKYITDTNIQSLTAGTQLHGIYLIFQQGNATEIGEI